MRLRHLFLFSLSFAGPGLLGQPAPHPAIGYLGIADQDIDANRAKELRLPQEAGVEVTLLAPNGPAAIAGVRLDSWSRLPNAPE
jgi:S1-C subfamily serine protease